MPFIFDPESGEELELTKEQYDTLKRFRDLVLPKMPDIGQAIITGTGGEMTSDQAIQLMQLFTKSESFNTIEYGQTNRTEQAPDTPGSDHPLGDRGPNGRSHPPGVRLDDLPGVQGQPFQLILPREPVWIQLAIPFPSMDEGYYAEHRLWWGQCTAGSDGESL